MGDEKRGDPETSLHLQQLGAHLNPQFRVEVAEGFVEQEHSGLADDGAADSHTLLLSAGQVFRLSVE